MSLRKAGPLAAASAIALAAFGTSPARPAYACTPGEDFNPVAESDIIVSGVILGWEETDAQEYQPPESSLKTIRVDLRVEDVVKGEAADTISFLDSGSLMNIPPDERGYVWAGSSGACGAFNADPTGHYVFMGLHRDEDGNLRSSLPRVFFIGERSAFAGSRYERTGEILSSFGLTRLPAAGHGSAYEAAGARVDAPLLTLGTFLVALGLGSLALGRSRE